MSDLHFNEVSNLWSGYVEPSAPPADEFDRTIDEEEGPFNIIFKSDNLPS